MDLAANQSWLCFYPLRQYTWSLLKHKKYKTFGYLLNDFYLGPVTLYLNLISREPKTKLSVNRLNRTGWTTIIGFTCRVIADQAVHLIN